MNLSFWVSVFILVLDKYQKVELLNCLIFFILIFEKLHTVFQNGSTNIQSHSLHKSSLFTTFLPTFFICFLIDNSQYDLCEVISHCGFDLYFPVYFLIHLGSNGFIPELSGLQISTSSTFSISFYLWFPEQPEFLWWSPHVTILIDSQNVSKLYIIILSFVGKIEPKHLR